MRLLVSLVRSVPQTGRRRHLYHEASGGHMSEQMSSGAIKIIEIMGVSPVSFQDAVDEAVSKAAESINGIIGVEVIHQAADVKDGGVTAYRVTLKLSFIVR